MLNYESGWAGFILWLVAIIPTVSFFYIIVMIIRKDNADIKGFIFPENWNETVSKMDKISDSQDKFIEGLQEVSKNMTEMMKIASDMEKRIEDRIVEENFVIPPEL